MAHKRSDRARRHPDRGRGSDYARGSHSWDEAEEQNPDVIPVAEASAPATVTRSVVSLLNKPVATASATAASLIGLLLALAPLLGSSTVMSLIGYPLVLWGAYQVALRQRSRKVRFVGVSCLGIAAMATALLVAAPIVRPGTVSFFYDGSLIDAPAGSPLSNANFPPLTDNPDVGDDVQDLVNPARLTVSCWVHGHYKQRELDWALIVDGDYRTLWIPVADLGAMGRGAVRTLLPCSSWRWRVGGLP